MQTLKRILYDLKHGENVDLYLTIVAAIFVAALNIYGLAPSSLVSSVTLAVLGLLAFSAVGNRHRLEKLLFIRNDLKRGSFLTQFPTDIEEQRFDSEELWMIGTSLKIAIPKHYSKLDSMLRRKCKIRVLLVEPDGIANDLAAKRLYRPTSPKEHKDDILSNLKLLCYLKQIDPTGLEIKVINYVYPFVIYATDLESPKGTVLLVYGGFKSSDNHEPKILLCSRDDPWYNYFKKQIYTLWEEASEWKCTD